MAVVVVALVVLAALTVFNLVLILGVLRRLREYSARMSFDGVQAGAVGGSVDLGLDVGSRPGPFRTTTVDGREVTSEMLDGPALVGFFAEGCRPCKDWLPRFTEAARALEPSVSSRGAESPRILAVVANVGAQPSALVADLRSGLGDDALVVREELGGPVSQAFKVLGYPALCRLGTDGTVETGVRHEVVAPRVTL